MAVLLIVSLATATSAIWQLLQPVSVLTGTVLEVTEAGTGNRSAQYNLVLVADQGEQRFVRLRNNGRIMRFLLESEQEKLSGVPVTVSARQGVATMLTLQGTSVSVSDSRIQPTLKLLVGLFPLLILFLHFQPRLGEKRPARTSAE